MVSFTLKAEYKGLKLWASDYNLPIFFFLPASVETVSQCLIYYNVKHKDIVLSQSILETGYFKSNVCVNNNNLFGLTKGYGTYLHFKHWTESVKYYLNFIQIRYKPPSEGYYQFLDRIKYATDKKYIYKLKNITNGRKNII